MPRAALAPAEALRASGPLDGPAVCIAGSGDGDGGSSIQCRGSPQILSSSYQVIVACDSRVTFAVGPIVTLLKLGNMERIP